MRSNLKVLDDNIRIGDREKAWTQVFLQLHDKGMPTQCTTVTKVKRAWDRLRSRSAKSIELYRQQKNSNADKIQPLSVVDQAIYDLYEYAKQNGIDMQTNGSGQLNISMPANQSSLSDALGMRGRSKSLGAATNTMPPLGSVVELDGKFPIVSLERLNLPAGLTSVKVTDTFQIASLTNHNIKNKKMVNGVSARKKRARTMTATSATLASFGFEATPIQNSNKRPRRSTVISKEPPEAYVSQKQPQPETLLRLQEEVAHHDLLIKQQRIQFDLQLHERSMMLKDLEIEQKRLEMEVLRRRMNDPY